MKVYTITHPHAQTAIYAAAHRYQWGLFATRRYVERMGCQFALYRLACQLQAGLA